MICHKCGKLLPKESQFCIQCGNPISTPDDNTDHEKSDDRIRKRIINVIAVLGAAACIFIAMIVIGEIQKDRDRKRAAFARTQGFYSGPLTTPTPEPTPFWKTESYQIEAKAIALQPGQMWWQPLLVENGWREPRLVGRFRAQGGGGNDIYAYVTNDDGLINLQNDHAFRQWYESGKVTVDTINARLPSGRSYFVLSNRFSVLAHKSVTFDLRVEYERLVQP